MHGSVSQRSVDEIAVELVLLQEQRPARTFNPDPEKWRKINDDYRDHMHREYLLEQEIYRRIGIDQGNELFRKLEKTVKLLT
jgi:hypothetical protein